MSRTPRLAPRPSAPWLATLLLLACPLTGLAAPTDTSVNEARQEAELAQSLANSPRGAAHLLRLQSFEQELEDLTPLAKTYAEVAGRSRTDPHTRATAQFLLMDLERARGRTTRAAEVREGLGFVGDYYVVGGFENEGKSGCDTDFGPEAASLDLSARYPGAKGREAAWRKLSVTPVEGYVDLGAALRPNRESVAYALTWLEAPAETRVALDVGTSGAFRLWVNGEKAASGDQYHLPRPDQARVSVRLRKGLNRVLVKVCQDTGPMGFFLRRDPPGRIRVALPETPPALAKGLSPAPQVLPTLTSALKDAVAKAPNDATLRGEYATVLDYFRAFDEREHTATVEAERAARAAPSDVRLQLLAATTQREDLNQRRVFLEAALRADPTSVQARVALAEFELERGHPERALELLGAVVKDAPESAAARLALARTHETLGESARAHMLVEETLSKLPRIPRVVRAAASSARALDRPQEAVGRLRVALALRHDDRTSRTLLATLLADQGQTDAAAREYAQLLALYPYDNATRLKLAELRAANGQLEAASAAFADARALSPDEPDVYEREGKALLSAGHRDEAVASFERALALRPQNPTLKEAVRTLKGESASAGLQYLPDFKPLIKQAEGYVHEDAVYLTDSTYVRVQKSGLAGRLHQFAVKVLNPRGVDAFRSIPVTYSPDRQEVRILRARITKPDGSVVDSYGESDRNINEPWTGMYYDARAKMLSFPALGVGDILELQYRLDDTAQDNLLSDYWGDVEHVQGVYPKVSYQFLVEMPKERPLYWNDTKLAGVKYAHEPVENGTRELYRWSAAHVAKVVPEPNMPGWAEVAANLHVSTYRTWDEVGRYWWGLVRDQLTPNDELRQTVDTVLKGVDRKNQQAVVRAIYNFVVTNTRYVALEFGIHGFKPYRVDRVLSRRFGDCKDKASLIHAMLKVAGVDSRLVLLRMRDLGSIGQEPASLAAFNHAIVYVPGMDLYLDGTAEFHGAKELPSADRVANVLVVEPGGKATFLTTPEAKADDNATRLGMDVVLRPDGSATVAGASTVGGHMAPEYRRAYRAVSSRKSTFERAWAQSFPGLTVQDVKLNDTTLLDDDVKVDFRMSIPRFAEALPGQLRFLPFGTGRAYTQTYASLAERRFDLVMSSPWVNRFAFRYTLPTGYSVAELPPALLEDTPFGRVRLSYKQEGQQLVAEGEVALTTARVKADDYPAFRAFLGRVDQGFARKVTLRGPPTTAER
ncbi:DUF3857 domain-containing protein [Melittangium boletus]|uniref:DUF3857 domain-containing protein n=1 Tax=Melittangium boletus TaxID=83453 RepID=UPI003DA4DFD5